MFKLVEESKAATALFMLTIIPEIAYQTQDVFLTVEYQTISLDHQDHLTSRVPHSPLVMEMRGTRGRVNKK